jgi:hypothetical protein
MTDGIIFQGDYVDCKFLRTRRVAQIIIEIPLERGAEFVAAFGAPNPAQGVPVALARLESAPPKQEPPARKSWNDFSYSQQAAIRCEDPDFQAFMETKMPGGMDTPSRVRHYCNITSRAELDDCDNKVSRACWNFLDKEFIAQRAHNQRTGAD